MSDLSNEFEQEPSGGAAKKAFAYDWSTIVAKPKKPKPPKVDALKPITEEEWAKLEPKGKWDSIVALRGPDLKNSDLLKWFTSSVIRWKLSGVMRVGGLVNNQVPFVVLPYHNQDTSNFSGQHFSGHVRDAAMWLGIPALAVSSKVWSYLLKGVGHRYVVLAMIQAELGQENPLRKVISDLLNAYGIEDPESLLAKQTEASNEN